MLNITTKRGGFIESGRVDGEAGSTDRRGGDGVERPLLVQPGQPSAPAGLSGGGGESVAGQVLCQEPAAAEQERPGRRAHTGSVGNARPAKISEPLVGAKLKEAARFAMRLVREQAQVCQRIQRLVDIGFPELREVWDDPTCVSALAVLRHAPTAAAVARMREDRLARLERPGAGGRVVGPMKAGQLKQLAATSVAAPELEQQVRFEMRLLIAQHDLLEQQIASADARTASLLDGEVSERLLSIPGVGPSTAATLMAEIGDIWRFSDVDQLLAYAGVHPKEQSSGAKGANPETSWTMAKTGNAYLRAAAYRMAVVGVQHNPILRAHYARKRAAGKSAMNALGHCMSKALAIVWGVWRGGKNFDPAHGSAGSA